MSVISNVTTANGFFIQTDAVTTGHAIRATVGGAVAGDAVFIDVANAGASGDALRLENIGSGLGLKVASGGAEFSGNMGFFGTTATTKPNITGSRGGNAALASLLTGLASLGLITDSTTA